MQHPQKTATLKHFYVIKNAAQKPKNLIPGRVAAAATCYVHLLNSFFHSLSTEWFYL